MTWVELEPAICSIHRLVAQADCACHSSATSLVLPDEYNAESSVFAGMFDQ